jgi:predicted dehydrogenase
MPLSRRNFIRTGFGSLSLGVLPSNIRASSTELQIGVIGVGRRGLRLLRELLLLKGVQIVGVCDEDANALKQVRSLVGKQVRLTSHYEEMLAWENLDAVIIATPDATHAEIAIAAVKAGKDVYLETPMTRTFEEAVELATAVQEYTHLVHVSSPLIDHARVVAAKTVIQGGVLGRIVQVTLAVKMTSLELAADWTKDRASANAARVFAPYLDVIYDMLGLEAPESSTAHGLVLHKDVNANSRNPDVFVGTLLYPEGVLLNLSFGAVQNAFIFHGLRESFDLYQLTVEDGSTHLADWLLCLCARTQPPAGVAMGLKHTQALELLERAYWTGSWQYHSA